MLLHNQSREHHHLPLLPFPLWYEFEMNNPEAEPLVNSTLVMDTHSCNICVCPPPSGACWKIHKRLVNSWVVVTCSPASRHTCITLTVASTANTNMHYRKVSSKVTILGAIWYHLSHDLEVLWINMYINMTLPLSGRIQCFTLHTVCKHTKKINCFVRQWCSTKQSRQVKMCTELIKRNHPNYIWSTSSTF